MKSISGFGILFTLLIALIFVLALTNFTPSLAAGDTMGTASTVLQTTPTPAAGGPSEIGSTDGILILGIVIVLIVTLPLVFRKKDRK